MLRQATRVGCKAVMQHLLDYRYLHTDPKETRFFGPSLDFNFGIRIQKVRFCSSFFGT